MTKSIADYLTNSDNKKLSIFQIAVLVYVVLLTFPSLIINVSGDADYSWYVGLHKAAREGMIFGKDIVFTYGPLGFLSVPVFINKTLWAYSALYTAAIYALVVFACSLFLRKTKSNLVKTLIFAVIFITIFKGMLNWRPGRDFELLVSLFIFCYLYIRSKGHLIGLSGLAFFYSLLPFIKFSSALAGGATGFIFLCILLKNKRIKEVFIFLFFFLASFIALGLLLIGSPGAILTYLYGCWQIASGYNETMAIKCQGNLYFPAVFAWISYIILLSYCFFKKRKSELIFLLLIAGLLFSSYKLGFVRLDVSHLANFYSMWLFLFVLFFISLSTNTKFLRYFTFSSVLIFFLLSILNILFIGKISFQNIYIPNDFKIKLENLQLSFNLFRGIGLEEQKTKNTMQLRKYFPLKAETVEMLSGHTMDIFQNNISIAEAYDFKWSPRPVFQSYSAYTEYLDSINAKHFQSDSAPEYILYGLDSINGRYAISDEPATFRTLLQRYKLCAQDANFIVLRKKSVFDANIIEEAPVTAKFEQMIKLPELKNEAIFVKINIRNNLLGLAQKILFKPALNTYMAFYIPEKNEMRVYRLVCQNARNGIFVSKIVKDQNDLLQVWKGNFRQDITGLMLLTDHPAMFRDRITIQVIKTPANKME